MLIGNLLLYATPSTTPQDAIRMAQASEERRFATLWRGEHVVTFPSYASAYPYASQSGEDGRGDWLLRPDVGYCDTFLQLTLLAAHTKRIRIGTGICIVPQRNPLYTASQVAGIDYLSGGRFNFGVGLGWSHEEYAILGVPWKGRGKRLDEYIELMKRLWVDHDSEFHGETYDMPVCRQYPKPIQKPYPPIYVGGEGEAALKRVATHGDGWIGMGLDPGQMPERLNRLTEILGENGRTRSSVKVAVAPYFRAISRAEAEDYAATGIDELIIMIATDSLDDTLRALDDHANLTELTREDELSPMSAP